ncbi:MAG: D-threonine aldolase [Thermomicrobiales bacterium]|jgi:D-serine deaminase-like pyridoxal phosphate-dependent protein|nr:D-threonine aldolase [Thermomicrobiales bacterium]
MLMSLVGLPISELDTPALLIDLDPFERNIAAMAADITARNCAWRPHTKVHKTPAIAHKQIAAGAIGVACAKVGEAEVMAAAGIRDILIANQIVGPIKTRRLAQLCRHAEVISSVDAVENVRELDAAAREHGVRIRIAIEVNVGMNRSGAEAGASAVALAQEIAGCEGLRLAGVMAWEGHAMAMPAGPEREAEIIRACRSLVETAEAIRAVGIPVEIVSAGGTGTYLTSAGVEGITEVQAGGGIFGDKIYRDFGARVEPALTLLTQVVSRPAPDRIIVDAGRKSIDPSLRPPIVKGMPTSQPIALSAEHGKILLDAPCDTPRAGERIEFVVGYGDQCNHLHENFIGVRNGIVETIWPIAARGRLQ